MAAATIAAGVGKSGSPAPKPTTSSPAAFLALALASTARVADSAMAPIRCETRRVAVDALGAELMAPSSQVPANRFPRGDRDGTGRACPYTRQVLGAMTV